MLGHRTAIALPFVLLALVTLVGGQVNRVDGRGQVVDDTTDQPVSNVVITYGSRSVVADENGFYLMPNLPRGARLRAENAGQPGYSRSFANAEDAKLRMIPATLTLVVNEEGSNPPKVVPNLEARQGTRIIGRASIEANMVIAPHPGKAATFLVCAPEYEPKTVEARGVSMAIELRKGGPGCPPLPSPSPLPGASPPPAPTTAPAPTATP